MLQTETLSLSGLPVPVGVTLKLIQRKRGSMELLEMFTMLDRSRLCSLTTVCFCSVGLTEVQTGCTALHQSALKDVQLVSGGAKTVSSQYEGGETTETGAPTSFPTHNTTQI